MLDATIAEGLFPSLLPGVYQHAFELDLRSYPDEGSPEYFRMCARAIDALGTRVSEGVQANHISRLAVFGFARIPVLVHLGSRLDDKVACRNFQRQRVDHGNAWKWPEPQALVPTFDWKKVIDGEKDQGVALLLNISGTIQPEELPADVAAGTVVYEIGPVQVDDRGPGIISSEAALANFESCLRRFFAMLEKDHGKISHLLVFPAVPLSCAITLGRVLMPDVSPALRLYERDDQKRFYEALEVKR